MVSSAGKSCKANVIALRGLATQGEASCTATTHLLVLAILDRITLEDLVRQATQVIHEWLQRRLEIVCVALSELGSCIGHFAHIARRVESGSGRRVGRGRRGVGNVSNILQVGIRTASCMSSQVGVAENECGFLLSCQREGAFVDHRMAGRLTFVIAFRNA